MPQENVHVVGDHVLGLECFPTPGHASHHVLLPRPRRDAVRGRRRRRAHPAGPLRHAADPAAGDRRRAVAANDRRDSTAAIPNVLPSIHFGVADDPSRHLADLRLELYDWAEFVRGGASEEEFVAYVRAELDNAGEDVSGLRPGDAALAVVPRPRRAGPRDSETTSRPRRNLPVRWATATSGCSSRAGDLVRRDVPRADRGRLRDPRSRGSATAVGLSFAAWTIAQVSMLAFGGVIGDRLPRRAVMISSDVASTCVRATMGVLLVTGHAHIWELIVLQAFGGAAVAFYNPAFYGLVREIVRPTGCSRRTATLRSRASQRFRSAPPPVARSSHSSVPAPRSCSTVARTRSARYCLSFVHVDRSAGRLERPARAARRLGGVHRAPVDLGADAVDLALLHASPTHRSSCSARTCRRVR